MTKDTKSPFPEIARHNDMHNRIWTDFAFFCEKWEIEKGATRWQMIEAITKGLLNLTKKRPAERLFQHPKDTKRFLKHIRKSADDEIKWYEKHYRGIHYAEEVEGADLLQLRDAKNFGLSEVEKIRQKIIDDGEADWIEES